MGAASEQRVAIVTGAGRGLGREHALALAARGAAVLVNDVGTTADGAGSAEATAAEIRAAGGTAVADRSDVASWEGAQALVEAAVDAFGRLDAIVNNAGAFDRCPVHELTAERFRRIHALHVDGPVATTVHALRRWRAHGCDRPSVVFVGSLSALTGFPGHGHYASAKLALVAFARIVALEGAELGLRANTVMPSARTLPPDSPHASGLTPPPPEDPDAFDPLLPAHVAPLVAWLAERDCPATGQLFHAYGDRVSVVAVGSVAGRAEAGRRRWTVEGLGRALPPLLARAPAVEDYVALDAG